MVSVFEGQLTRTWYFENEGRKHVLNLYHDTISGVRSAALDYQEIKGSLGNSSLLMESKGHRIFFNVGKLPGYLEIKRSGWTGFEYGCLINGSVIKEVTQGVPENQDLLFQPKIADTTFTADEHSEYPIAWYVIRTRRITDGVQTTVHRRFREFAELNSQIKQNMKGHHLRDVLPPLPDKPMKQFTDHKDLNFIQERMFKLETFLNNMVSIPHVANMVCMKAFVGIMDQVREYSLTFHVPTLGMSLLPTERQGESGVSPCVVGLIQKPEVCTGVLPGDSVSRVNGVPLGGSTFNGAIARIRSLPRPLIIHFIQMISARPGPSTGTVGGQVSDVGEASGHIVDEVPDVLAIEEEELAERRSAHSVGVVSAVQKGRHSRDAHSPVQFVDVDIVEDPPVRTQKAKSAAPARTATHVDAAPMVAPPMFQPAKARTPAGTSGSKAATPAAAATTTTQKTQVKKKVVAVATTSTVVATTAPVKETAIPAPAPSRNLAAFEDSKAPVSQVPTPTLQHSAESSDSIASITATAQSTNRGKNPLFSNEVDGFGPSSSTSASAAEHTPAVAVPQSTASTANTSKNPLFDNEVPGFSVAPGLSPTTSSHTRPSATVATASKTAPSAPTTRVTTKPAESSSTIEASASPVAASVRRPAAASSTPTTEASVTKPSRTSYSTATTQPAAAAQPSNSLLGWD